MQNIWYLAWASGRCQAWGRGENGSLGVHFWHGGLVVFSVQYMVCLGRLDDHTRRREKKIKSMDTGVAQAKFFFPRGFLSVMVRSNVASRTSFSEGRCCRETAAWVLCCCVCVEKRGQKLTGTRGWLGAKGGSLIPAMISSARLPWKRKSGLGLDAGAVEQCGEQMGFGAGLCCFFAVMWDERQLEETKKAFLGPTRQKGRRLVMSLAMKVDVLPIG